MLVDDGKRALNVAPLRPGTRRAALSRVTLSAGALICQNATWIAPEGHVPNDDVAPSPPCPAPGASRSTQHRGRRTAAMEPRRPLRGPRRAGLFGRPRPRRSRGGTVRPAISRQTGSAGGRERCQRPARRSGFCIREHRGNAGPRRILREPRLRRGHRRSGPGQVFRRRAGAGDGHFLRPAVFHPRPQPDR